MLLVTPSQYIHKVAETDFPTRWGQFRILGFEGHFPAGNGERRKGAAGAPGGGGGPGAVGGRREGRPHAPGATRPRAGPTAPGPAEPIGSPISE